MVLNGKISITASHIYYMDFSKRTHVCYNYITQYPNYIKGGHTMQVSLNTRLELELRQRLDAYVQKVNRSIAQITAEAIEKYLDEKEKKE